MKATRTRDTNGMLENPRSAQTQRPRDGRPAKSPRAEAGARIPSDPTENDRSDWTDESIPQDPWAEAEESRARPVEHLPGDVHAAPTADIWPGHAADGMRERWRDLQALFVDDPRAAAEGADAVLAETIETLSRSLESARSDLAEWRTKQDVDTEGLRVTLQRYRTVLDRVLAL
jgi:hypothetical protein